MSILNNKQLIELQNHLSVDGILINDSMLSTLIDGTDKWYQTHNLARPEDTYPKVHIRSVVNEQGCLVSYRDMKGETGHWNCSVKNISLSPIPATPPTPEYNPNLDTVYQQYKKNEPSTKTHPYARDKQIGIATDTIVTLDDEGNLIIPVMQDNHITGLQSISPTGNKKFVYSSKTKDACLHYPSLVNNPTTAYVCEGWADAKHLHSITHCSVYIAFSVGQLQSTVEYATIQNPNLPIVLVADNDTVGITTAQKVQASTGCSLIIPTVGKDVSDIFIAHGIKGVLDMLSNSVAPDTSTEQVSVIPDTPNPLLSDYDSKPDGLYYKNKWLSQTVTPTALTADVNKEQHGLAIVFNDKRNRAVTANVSIEQLQANPSREIARLCGLGLVVVHTPYSHRTLANYFVLFTPSKDKVIINKHGFINNTNIYITGNKTYGDTKAEYIFDGSNPSDIGMMEQQGTLEEWYDNIVYPCSVSNRMLFALLLGFTAPLLSLFGKTGYGVHFYGETSKGKTTLARVASSIYGNGRKYTGTWGETLTALETVVYLRNDALLVLDDTSDRRSGVLNSAIYMIANGRGDGRGTPTGERRESKTWTTLAISTGEASIKDLHYQDTHNPNMPEGADVRMISIPVEAGAGVFEQSNNPSKLSKQLLHDTQKYYGVAGDKWIDHLCRQEDIRRRYNKHVTDKVHTQHYQHLTPQASRVMELYELVAFVAHETIRAGVLPSALNEQLQTAINVCWEAWINTDAGAGNRNLSQLLERLDNCLETKRHNSFEHKGKSAEMIHNFLGYNVLIHKQSMERVTDTSIIYDDDTHYDVYMFTTSSFTTEIKGMLDTVRALQYLHTEGRLLLWNSSKTDDPTNKRYYQWRIKIDGKMRWLYALLPKEIETKTRETNANTGEGETKTRETNANTAERETKTAVINPVSNVIEIDKYELY